MPASANAGDQGSRRDPQLKRLLIRPGAIGDTIVSLPALEFAHAEYTEVWVAEPNVPLIRFADRVRSISSTGLDLLELELDDRARQLLTEFDSILSWYGSSRPHFREAVKHLPFDFFPSLPDDSTVHATDFYMRQVGGPDGATPLIHIPKAAPRQFIAVHPFSGSPKKNWPSERFRELAASLPLAVEFTAGPEEALDGAVRFDSLANLAQWLAGARLYIGNDSGVTHLAAAVGVPVVAIFRASNPAVWAPRGRAQVTVLAGDPEVECVRSAALRLLT